MLENQHRTNIHIQRILSRFGAIDRKTLPQLELEMKTLFRSASFPPRIWDLYRSTSTMATRVGTMLEAYVNAAQIITLADLAAAVLDIRELSHATCLADIEADLGPLRCMYPVESLFEPLSDEDDEKAMQQYCETITAAAVAKHIADSVAKFQFRTRGNRDAAAKFSLTEAMEDFSPGVNYRHFVHIRGLGREKAEGFLLHWFRMAEKKRFGIERAYRDTIQRQVEFLVHDNIEDEQMTAMRITLTQQLQWLTASIRKEPVQKAVRMISEFLRSHVTGSLSDTACKKLSILMYGSIASMQAPAVPYIEPVILHDLLQREVEVASQASELLITHSDSVAEALIAIDRDLMSHFSPDPALRPCTLTWFLSQSEKFRQALDAGTSSSPLSRTV